MDERTVEESLLLEGDVSVGEASWLEGKSQMLDEVNQLVEMMTAEKSKLQEKILALESEVEGYQKQTKQLKLREECVLRLKIEQQSLLKDKKSKEQLLLCTTLRKTREELKSVQHQVDSITQILKAERQCHLAARSKLESAEKNNMDLSEALHREQTENKKMEDLLQRAQEQTQDAQSRHHTQESLMNNLKEKEKKWREEILALRGRLARSQRANSQLQSHCSVLEKEVEAQGKQISSMRSRRSKEEMRLVQECRKKDELLATYLHKISTSQEEQKTLQKQIRGLKMKLSSEEKQRKEMILKLEEREQKYLDLQNQMEESTHLRKEEGNRAVLQQSVLQEKVKRLTEKLESSQGELLQLRPEVWRLRERGERYSEQLKRKEEEVDGLRRQLETAWSDHHSSIQRTEAQWTARLREAGRDYERLREVSTRRCVELAKEVWQLKSALAESNHT